MGVVFAGFMKILLPLLVVIPGIVAFKLYPGLATKTRPFRHWCANWCPSGLSGIVMAGLASGMLSHISSVLNSCSTVFTMDLYKPFLGRGKSEAHLVGVGRLSAFGILALATVLALWFTRRKLGVFDLIQNVGAWVAAPIAAVFLLGVLWRRTTAAAATFVLLFAFPYTVFVEYYLFKYVSWLVPFDNWLNRTFLVWLSSMFLLVVVSLLTTPPSAEKIKGIIWSWRLARLPETERERNRGVRNLFLWWCIFIASYGRAVCLHDLVPILGARPQRGQALNSGMSAYESKIIARSHPRPSGAGHLRPRCAPDCGSSRARTPASCWPAPAKRSPESRAARRSTNPRSRIPMAAAKRSPATIFPGGPRLVLSD